MGLILSFPFYVYFDTVFVIFFSPLFLISTLYFRQLCKKEKKFDARYCLSDPPAVINFTLLSTYEAFFNP